MSATATAIQPRTQRHAREDCTLSPPTPRVATPAPLPHNAFTGAADTDR